MIMGADLMMQHTFMALKLNIFQKKLKSHRIQKDHNKYVWKTSIRFNSKWILPHWIY